MYKLIIADDDEILLEGLTTGIPWQELDIQIAASLNDGIHVEEKIAETGADFLLTDIRMSQMDGLALLDRIHQKTPDFPVIMLSAYDEFSYVQQALKHGALDYLLKPVELSQLYEVMEKAKAVLNRKREEIAKNQKIQQSLEETRSYRQKMFLARCLEEFNDTLSGQCAEFPLPLEDEWCVTELRINPENNDALLQVLEEYALGQGCFFLNRSPAERLLILHAPSNLSEKLLEFQASCRELAASFEKTRLSFINGAIGKGLESLPQSMESVRRLRSYAFSEGSFTDLSEQNVRKYENRIPALNRGLMENLIKVVASGKTELIDNYTDKLKEHLRQAGNNSILLLSYVTGMIYDGIKESLHWEGFNEQYFDSLYTQVLNQKTLEGAMDTLAQEAKAISEKVSSSGYAAGKSIVRLACAYVDENYGNSELRVTDVAKYVGLSPNYFSKVFAEEMNISFTDYLIEKRMQEAQRLLLYTSCTSSEIAERVGYPNASYFSNVFKKYTGFTASQFKKNVDDSGMA